MTRKMVSSIATLTTAKTIFSTRCILKTIPQQRLHHIYGPDQLNGGRFRQIAAHEQGGRLGVMRHRDYRGEREPARVPVEVKRAQVARGYFVVMDDLGAGDEPAVPLRQHNLGILHGGQVLMTMPESFNYPGGLDVNKDCPVIRRMARCEHAYNVHLERVDAAQVEWILRGGNEGVSGTETELAGYRGPQNTLAEHRKHAARFNLQPPEIHVIHGRAYNRISPCRVAVVNGYGKGETGLINLLQTHAWLTVSGGLEAK